MNIEEIRKNKPEGATHFDGIDYWKHEQNMWFIWFESNSTWNQILDYQVFRNTFDIQPIN